MQSRLNTAGDRTIHSSTFRCLRKARCRIASTAAPRQSNIHSTRLALCSSASNRGQSENGHGGLVLEDVIWYGREVNHIEEERNVRVALETSVTRELARIDLAHVHKRIQVPNQVPGLHIRRAYHRSRSRRCIGRVTRFLLRGTGSNRGNVRFLGRDCRRSNEVSNCRRGEEYRST